METIQINSIGLILILLTAIVVGAIITFIVLNRRGKNKVVHTQSKEQAKPIRTIKAMLMASNEVNLLGDIVMPIFLPEPLMIGRIVFIKYYHDYKAMVVLMYDPEVGYVLIPEDSTSDPKFYELHKVLPCRPNVFVEGWIKKDDHDTGDDIFVITSIPDQEVELSPLPEQIN